MLRARCAASALAVAILGEAILLDTTENRDASLVEERVEEELDFPARLNGIAPDVFRKKWMNLTSEQPPPPEAPADDGLRVLVGVFSNSSTGDQPFRNVVRTTWMNQEGVCALGREEGPKAGCSVYVTFVVPGGHQGGRTEIGYIKEGKVIEGRAEGHATDMTVLPMHESMSCDKIPFWFFHAQKKHGWATHIVKMDIDVFPRVQELLATIRRGPTVRRCSQYPQDIFGGRVGEKACSHGMCWQSYQGGMYLMSMELAKKVTKPGSWWHEESKKWQDMGKPCRPDDVITGEAVLDHVMRHGECVNRIDFEPGRQYVHDM